MTTAQQLNVKLCRALGIEDVSRVFRVVLTIEPNALPKIEVSSHVRDQQADCLAAMVQVLELAPRP